MNGKWSEKLSAWWSGDNGCEYVAWKGSHEIAVYPCDNYPNLPTHMIQGDRRIETLEDFNHVLKTGKKFACNYELVTVKSKN